MDANEHLEINRGPAYCMKGGFSQKYFMRTSQSSPAYSVLRIFLKRFGSAHVALKKCRGSFVLSSFIHSFGILSYRHRRIQPSDINSHSFSPERKEVVLFFNGL